MNELVSTIGRNVFIVALIIGGFWFFKSSAKARIEAGDNSMSASTHPNGNYKVDTSLQRASDYQAGDVVAYYLPGEPEKHLVARVVAIEGQSVAILEKGLQVDGKIIDQHDVTGQQRFPETRVPRGCLYLVADKSTYGNDSAKLGPIPMYLIMGKL